MATNIKTVAYSLYENKLRDPEEFGKKGYCARIRTKGNVEEKDLVQMISERNTTVTPQEVESVLRHLEEVVMTSILMGYNVHTGIFNTSLSIRGNFEDMQDEFDSDRHSVKLNIRPAMDFKKLAKDQLVLEKAKATLLLPVVYTLYDYASDSENLTVTPGHVIDLKGINFQFDLEDERQGVFFINAESGERVKSPRIKSWSPATIVCFVPEALATGNYSVEVACGFGAAVRDTVLAEAVTVGEEVTA